MMTIGWVCTGWAEGHPRYTLSCNFQHTYHCRPWMYPCAYYANPEWTKSGIVLPRENNGVGLTVSGLEYFNDNYSVAYPHSDDWILGGENISWTLTSVGDWVHPDIKEGCS